LLIYRVHFEKRELIEVIEEYLKDKAQQQYPRSKEDHQIACAEHEKCK
jgi:hypothetical protein